MPKYSLSVEDSVTTPAAAAQTPAQHQNGSFDLPPVRHTSTNDGNIEIIEEEEQENGRAQWGGYCDFLLTCIGYCVGLGNVWRFPYLCFKNGGGAFIIPYVLSLLLMGIPLYFLELAFGQFASLGPITIWKASPLFRGLGYAMVIVNCVISLYYIVIVAWVWFFFFSTMRSTVPWLDCNNAWNTPNCFDRQQATNCTSINATFFNGTVTNCSNIKDMLEGTKTPAHEYFYNYVLEMTEGLHDVGGMRWPLVGTLALSWLVVFLVLVKGVASLGKVAYFSSLFPYAMMTALLVRGVTLEGASKGIEFYMIPKWERLADIQVWSDAANQIFYSLGISIGALTAMSSFNKFNHMCLRDALIVPFINCATSIFAGFAVFAVLGFMATKADLPVDKVATEGPGLVFVVYPEGLAQMPGSPVAWSILFFFMMLLLGYSSQFSQMETIITAFNDEAGGWPLTGRWRAIIYRALVCLIGFLLGLPLVTKGGFYLFTIFDTYAGGFPLLIIGLLELVVLIYVYGFNRYAEDIEMMIGWKPNIIFRIFWGFITPVLLLVIIILKIIMYKPLKLGDYVYPTWYAAIAWSLVALPVVFMIVIFVYVYCKNGGFQVLVNNARPAQDWGPALNKNRTGLYEPITSRKREPSPSYKITNGIDQPPPEYTNVINAYDTDYNHITSDRNSSTVAEKGGQVNSAYEGVEMAERRF